MINLLVSVNKRFFEYLKVMTFSCCRHASEDITVYLLNQSLSAEDCDEYRDFLKTKCNAELVVIDLDGEIFDNLPLGILSKEMYSRIIAQFCLPKELDRILWLDADIVVKKDISEFYYQDFEDNYYVVCEELWSVMDNDYVRKIKADMDMNMDSKYFNSGVMLMNLDKLRKETAYNNIINTCVKYKDVLMFPDQDILNHLYEGNLKYQDWQIYNCQRTKAKELSAVNMNDVVILHYNGIRKPWDIKFLDKRAKYYWKEYYLMHGFFSIFKIAGFYIAGSVLFVGQNLFKTFFGSIFDKLKVKILKGKIN